MLNAFQPCFTMALFLSVQRAETEGEAVPAAKYRAILLEKLALGEGLVMTRWGEEAAAAARRMVTVCLDEILNCAPWPGREEWLRKPLQSEWGEGRSGGAWFFQYLEGLSPARRDGRELAALALRCISLGLSGPYGRDAEALGQVRRDIQHNFSFHGSPVFPPPLPPLGRKKSAFFALKILAAALAALGLLGLAGALSLEARLNSLVEENRLL